MSDVVTVQTGASQEANGDPGWEPEWVFGYFTASGTCANRECRETAVLLGEMKVDADLDEKGNWYGEHDTFLRLRYAEPPLSLIRVPAKCPPSVRDAIRSASRVMWGDPASGGNRLRVAVEELLTALRVRKTGDGRRRLSTHKRIELLRTTRQDVAETLEAVKWIGNAGSHSQAPSLLDVLEGASLLDHALRQVYDRSDQELARLAKRVNGRRGRPIARDRLR